MRIMETKDSTQVTHIIGDECTTDVRMKKAKLDHSVLSRTNGSIEGNLVNSSVIKEESNHLVHASDLPNSSNCSIELLDQKFKKRKETSESSEKQNIIKNEVNLENQPVSKFAHAFPGGTLLFCGTVSWEKIGRKGIKKEELICIWSPHRLNAFNGIKVSFVASHCSGAHSIIITDTGITYSWGRNDKGQLGLGDVEKRSKPSVISDLKDFHMIAAACGKNHSLCLTDRGSVFAFGENRMGQLGIGNQHPVVHTPSKIKFRGPPIVKVACGSEYSVILDQFGALYTFGCPEYGQLGHNTDGKYFASSNKMAFSCELVPRRIVLYVDKSRDGMITTIDNVEILSMACGNNHNVAVDTFKRCFSWGFGGYGRLGHSEPRDEMVPRLIRVFDGTTKPVQTVYAGSTYSIAITESKVPYFFGATKKTGEATMYPKPIQDLQGWNVNAVGCSQASIVIAADNTVISWGPSPTYGELGLGETRKSASWPEEVKSLEGISVQQIAMGMGHAILVAQGHESDLLLSQLPVYPI